MNCILYINQSEANVVNKNIISEKEYPATLKQEPGIVDLSSIPGGVSVINPTILINTSDVLWRYNYCYIEEFNRYYFITDIRSVRANLVEIELEVDTLMSFKEEFLLNNAVIDRSQIIYNMLLMDDNLPVEQDTDFNRYVYSNGPFNKADSSVKNNVIMVALNSYVGGFPNAIG